MDAGEDWKNSRVDDFLYVFAFLFQISFVLALPENFYK